jgi:hypothetical protein
MLMYVYEQIAMLLKLKKPFLLRAFFLVFNFLWYIEFLLYFFVFVFFLFVVQFFQFGCPRKYTLWNLFLLKLLLHTQEIICIYIYFFFQYPSSCFGSQIIEIYVLKWIIYI